MNPVVSIFTDISFDNKSKSGVAGMLLLKGEIESHSLDISKKIVVRHFTNTNCNRLEIEAVIWALEKLKSIHTQQEVYIYTDCKTVVNLPKRRERLEKMNFKSSSTGLALNNGDLYRKLFKLIDEHHPKLTWIKGHKPKNNKNHLDHLFSTVDRKTREVLRAQTKALDPRR